MTKKLISLRIDTDIIDAFKNSGKNYQTRINHALRMFIENEKNFMTQKQIEHAKNLLRFSSPEDVAKIMNIQLTTLHRYIVEGKV